MANGNIISQDSWCTTLTKDTPECTWPEKPVDDDDVQHHLMVEQAVLGLNAKETCLVEATMKMVDGSERKVMICHLIPKIVVQSTHTLTFKAVKLRLAAGDGPVYLAGTQSGVWLDMQGSDEESEDEEMPMLVNGEAEEADGDEDSSEGEEAPCPLCNKDFPLDKIEAHADICADTFYTEPSHADICADTLYNHADICADTVEQAKIRTSESDPADRDSTMQEDNFCSICFENLKNVAFMCGHRTCDTCAAQLRDCPMCREKITHTIRLY